MSLALPLPTLLVLEDAVTHLLLVGGLVLGILTQLEVLTLLLHVVVVEDALLLLLGNEEGALVLPLNMPGLGVQLLKGAGVDC